MVRPEAKEKIKTLQVGNKHQGVWSECKSCLVATALLCIFSGFVGIGVDSVFASEPSPSLLWSQPGLMRLAQQQTIPPTMTGPNQTGSLPEGVLAAPMPSPAQAGGQAQSTLPQPLPTQMTPSPQGGTTGAPPQTLPFTSPQVIQPQTPSPRQPPGGRPQPQPIPSGPQGVVPELAKPMDGQGQPQAQPTQVPGLRRPPVSSAGMISLNFDDADIFSVIQTVFGDILKVNYVVDPKVQGRVTFRSVAPVSRDQVLPIMEVILRINAIGVVEDNGLYRIVPLSEVSREPSPISFGRDPDKISAQGKSLIQVVPIIYLQSTEVVKLITPFLSATAVVLDVPKSNQVIVVDTDASVRRVLQLIGTFDNETQKKKRAQVFVYPVQNLKARDIANLLNQIFFGIRGYTTATRARPGTAATSGQPLAQQPLPTAQALTQAGQQGRSMTAESLVSEITRIYSDDITNSVIALATPEDYETIKEAIIKLDIVPRQVVIEGVVAQVSLSDNLSLGLSYSMRGSINVRDTRFSANFGVNTDVLSKQTANTVASSGFALVGTDDQGVVRAYVNALASEDRAKLLAAPHILVSDNREARIQVGSQVPIVTSETFGSGTVAPQRTIQYKDTGIILKVKPQVNESGLVSLELSQEVSTFRTQQLFANETQIILDKTEATTSLVVQDGQTVIIGGLIREDTDRTRQGVPFLSKIPILGYLFGNTSRTATRVEIIILLTPRVVKNQREARGITSEYIDNITSTDTSKGGLRRDDLLRGGVQLRRGTDSVPENETPYPDQQPIGQMPSTERPLQPR
jgi:type II secretory pathway component GspD/PulD (secretin)